MFAEYLNGSRPIHTHPMRGLEAIYHAVCWAMQRRVSRNGGDKPGLLLSRPVQEMSFVEKQMARGCSFPTGMRRTKPYGYSLFVIDAHDGWRSSLQRQGDDLWSFELPERARD